MPIIKVDSTVGYADNTALGTDRIVSTREIVSINTTLNDTGYSYLRVQRTTGAFQIESVDGKQRSGYGVRYLMSNSTYTDKSNYKLVSNTVMVVPFGDTAEYIRNLAVGDTVQMGMRFTGEGTRTFLLVVNKRVTMLSGTTHYCEIRIKRTETTYSLEFYLNGALDQTITLADPSTANLLRCEIEGYWAPTSPNLTSTPASSFTGAVAIGDIYLAVDKAGETPTPIYGSLTAVSHQVAAVSYSGVWTTGTQTTAASNESLLAAINRKPSITDTNATEAQTSSFYVRSDPTGEPLSFALPQLSNDCVAFGISALVGRPTGGMVNPFLDIVKSSGELVQKYAFPTPPLAGAKFTNIAQEIDPLFDGSIARRFNGTTVKIYASTKVGS